MPIDVEIDSKYEYYVEYTDEDNGPLRDQRVDPAAFCRAVAHTRLDALRRDLDEYDRLLATAARIEPEFPADRSPSPHAKGFRVTISLASGGEHTCRFGLDYFRPDAGRLRAELVRSEAIGRDRKVYYRLCAFLAVQDDPPPAGKLGISLAPAVPCLRVGSGCRDELGACEAWDDPRAEDLPVLVDRGVLEEIVDEAAASPEEEIGGFLLGHVKRDPRSREVFLVVTGLASAAATAEASSSSVTFRPASFAHARSIIQLRGDAESICGWYHSHPFRLCADCPYPARPECIDRVLFYSLDDVHLMETTFDQPYMVGLLAAVEPRIAEAVGHLPIKLYGWNGGLIRARGFHVFRRDAGGSQGPSPR